MSICVNQSSMTNKQKQQCLSVLRWYRENRRNLPWRNTRNPYRILVSEMMLQQTQVERVIPIYKEFFHRFPTIHALSDAKPKDVIVAWKGLGYNRRAVYLNKTAKMIVQNFNGKIPRTLAELKTLSGIGDYTARAILSFAFLEPVAVLDTNHRQFYQELFFKEKKKDLELLEKAEEVVQWLVHEHEPPSGSPLRGGRSKLVYDWNQAVMDYVSCNMKHVPYNMVEKTNVIPFQESDRYFRGRIVDDLREEKSVQLIVCRKRFGEIDDVRFEMIVRGLERDGLIKRTGKRILLPA